MRIVLEILKFIVNPFRTFGFGKSSDDISKFVSKHTYVLYISAFLITALIIFVRYFI